MTDECAQYLATHPFPRISNPVELVPPFKDYRALRQGRRRRKRLDGGGGGGRGGGDGCGGGGGFGSRGLRRCKVGLPLQLG